MTLQPCLVAAELPVQTCEPRTCSVRLCSWLQQEASLTRLAPSRQQAILPSSSEGSWSSRLGSILRTHEQLSDRMLQHASSCSTAGSRALYSAAPHLSSGELRCSCEIRAAPGYGKLTSFSACTTFVQSATGALFSGQHSSKSRAQLRSCAAVSCHSVARKKTGMWMVTAASCIPFPTHSGLGSFRKNVSLTCCNLTRAPVSTNLLNPRLDTHGRPLRRQPVSCNYKAA